VRLETLPEGEDKQRVEAFAQHLRQAIADLKLMGDASASSPLVQQSQMNQNPATTRLTDLPSPPPYAPILPTNPTPATLPATIAPAASTSVVFHQPAPSR
jgi:hypothetical protein